MSTPARLAAFALVLALLFGAGTLAGAVAGPEPTTAADPHASAPDTHAGTRPAARGHGEHQAHPVRGLAVAENGLRLVLADPELRRGRTERLAFRIVGEDGRTAREFDVAHERRMHLILARRDLTGFQHLHPRQREDGRWATRVRVDEAGSYRVFADFTRDGEAVTLAADVRVDGAADLRPLPAAEPAAVSDGGYDLRLEVGRARPGKEATLRFAISRDGRTVHPQPYLGARGHLVALREGDLAFLHVHPTQHGHADDAPATGEHDDAIGFAATFPTEGRYRLFLQFRHAGRVHTAAFTQAVA